MHCTLLLLPFSLHSNMFRRTERHLHGVNQRFFVSAGRLNRESSLQADAEAFGALPEDDVPYVETCRCEVKKAIKAVCSAFS
jgi:hypothetical protein